MESDKGRLNYGTGLDNSQLRVGAAEARRLLHGIGDAASEEGNRIDDTMKKIGQAAAGVAAVSQIKSFVTQVANVRGQFQQLEQAFKTMLGSAEEADTLMQQLIKTAATTPFGMTDIAQGAKQLLAYGVQADSVNETLIRLGDIAAGLSIPLNDLTYLYGTTMVQGRMYTQDLNQFLGRGIPLTDELAKQFGVAKDKVKELVTEGKVGFPEVEKAIVALTSEGGKFGGLMAAQSQTITGIISNIEDSIEQMFNELGKKSEGVITDVLSLTSTAVEHWEEIGKTLLVVISAYGSYKAAVLAVAAAHKLAAVWGQVSAFLSLAKSVTSAKDAMLLLNMATKASPWGILLSTIAAAASAILLFKDNTEEAVSAQQKASDAIQDYNKTVAAEKKQIDAAFDSLKKAKKGTEAYDAAKQAIISQYGKYLNGLKSEVQSLKDIEAAYKAVSTAAREAAKARAMDKLEQDAADTYATTEAEQKEKLYQVLKDRFGDTSETDSAYWQLVSVMEGKGSPDENIVRQFDKSWMNGTTTNVVREILSAVSEAQSVYNETMAEAARRFGENPLGGQTETAAVVENKQYWEDYQKEQQGLLDAMTEAELQTTEAAQIRANIAKAQAKINAYNVTKTTTAADKVEDQTAERIGKIQEYKETVIAANAEAELDIRQKEIENMQEGYEKQKAQIDLNYDRLISENKKRAQSMIEDLTDEKALEYQNSNPNASKAQTLAYKASLNLTAADLSQEQQEQLAAYDKLAEETRIKGYREALNTMLQDSLTYEQQREKIAEEYAHKRASLYVDGKEENGLREGVTQGNVDELNYQEEQALTAVDTQFAQREETYKAWCNEIANMTLEQLQALLKQAEEELQKAERDNKGGTGSSQKLAVARAKVTTTKNNIAETKAKTDLDPDKRSLKEWEDLYRTLNDVNSSFDEIGNAVGGLAGDILKTAGQISTSALSMINGIMQLTQSSSAGVQTAATTSSKAIKTVEEASVILTIITAAIEIATKIASLFNNDDSKQEEIEALQSRIDQLQWELDNADIVRLQETSGKAIDLVKQKLQETRDEMLKGIDTLSNFEAMWARLSLRVSRSDTLLKQSAEKIAEAYANVAYTADKALGGKTFDDAKTQLENIAKQQLLIQEQIETEQSKKKTDSDKIEEWEQKIEELGAEAISVINDMVEEIMGGSSSDIAEQLSDAFFEAFQNGEDYAQAWHDEVNDLVADIAKNLLVQKFLEEPLGEVFDKYKAQWFKDGKFVGIDAVLSSLSSLTTDLNTVGDDWITIWEALPQQVQDMITAASDSTRETSSSGIASASQDTVDELNGRATAIQGHTYSISENTKLLLTTANLILQSVLNIENNTDGLSERVAGMESRVKEIRDTVNDIALKGIAIK